MISLKIPLNGTEYYFTTLITSKDTISFVGRLWIDNFNLSKSFDSHFSAYDTYSLFFNEHFKHHPSMLPSMKQNVFIQDFSRKATYCIQTTNSIIPWDFDSNGCFIQGSYSNIVKLTQQEKWDRVMGKG